ncbi:MAG: cupredoxin domain-containing protein [Methanoregula sp.]|nr:MAG: cupredoxin domain-containing protein [Methanoregula sp.]
MKLAIPLGLLIVLALISCGCMTMSPASPVTTSPTAAMMTISPQTIAHSGGSGVTIPIRIKENNFDPDFITVKVGTTVVWTNEDPRTHTVTYLGSDIMRFDSGPLATGQTFSNAFTAPGRYVYTDKQYSYMKGTVLVE